MRYTCPNCGKELQQGDHSTLICECGFSCKKESFKTAAEIAEENYSAENSEGTSKKIEIPKADQSDLLLQIATKGINDMLTSSDRSLEEKLQSDKVLQGIFADIQNNTARIADALEKMIEIESELVAEKEQPAETPAAPVQSETVQPTETAPL